MVNKLDQKLLSLVNVYNLCDIYFKCNENVTKIKIIFIPAKSKDGYYTKLVI